MNSSTTARAAARASASSPARGLLATIALFALIGAGCSTAPAETGPVADGSQNTGGTENAATEAAPAPERKGRLVEFSECMRENGVEDFPDPDDNGVIQFRGGADTPEFRSARETCRAVLPEGLGAPGGAPGGGG